MDMAVPRDHNINVKEMEKLKKYPEFQIAVIRTWDVQAIGVLRGGCIPLNLKTYIMEIGIKPSISSLRKPTNILRKMLSMWGLEVHIQCKINGWKRKAVRKTKQ